MGLLVLDEVTHIHGLELFVKGPVLWKDGGRQRHIGFMLVSKL